MKVFPDTNVWLSAVIFAGLCEALIADCAERHTLLTSPLVREEAHAVLRRKFPHIPSATRLFDQAWRAAHCVADYAEPEGDNDARLVATAHAAGSEIFITGDRRVLGWRQVGTLRILAPRAAWIELFAPHLRGG